MKFRAIETWLRRRRVAAFKWFSASTRGRKLLLDALPKNVVEMTLDCGDHLITVSPHEMIGRHVISRGDYTRSAVDEIVAELERRKLLRTGGCVLEIGANIGTHTIYLALTGKFDRMIAVEPDPRNVALLRRNVEINGLGGRVSVVECAAGEKAGELVLHRIAGNFGNSSFVHAAPTGDSVSVPVKPVDAILRETQTPMESVSLVWMDIEGFEPQACLSMLGLLKRRVPFYLEFSPEFYGKQGTEDFARFLSQYYDHCIIIQKAGARHGKVEELAGISRQCDVLLLP